MTLDCVYCNLVMTGILISIHHMTMSSHVTTICEMQLFFTTKQSCLLDIDLYFCPLLLTRYEMHTMINQPRKVTMIAQKSI